MDCCKVVDHLGTELTEAVLSPCLADSGKKSSLKQCRSDQLASKEAS